MTSVKHNKTNYVEEGYIVNKDDGTEEVIQIPYNINNFLASENDIINILKLLNVKIDKINNINLFHKSFTHKSYCKKNLIPEKVLIHSKDEMGNPKNLLELRDKSYERLEYFGDRVVKLIISKYLFYRYPNENEGFMTRLQTKLEDKKNLSTMSKKIGLGKFFIISKHIEQLNGRKLDKIHEDVFEAFIGALYLSNGLETCVWFLINLLETMIDYSDKLYRDNNYKDKLLRYHHKQKWKFPKYIMIYYEGPAHKRKYIMGVEKQLENDEKNLDLKERCISFGFGNSKKEGEQNAAKMSLIIYGQLKSDQYKKSDIYYPPWNKIKNNNDEEYLIFLDDKDNKNKDEKEENNNQNNNNIDFTINENFNSSDSDKSEFSNISEETDSD